MQLTGEQISTITKSSYYHLKHYHDLGADNAQEWISQIESVYNSSSSYLQNIIINQQNRELQRLNQIFQGQCQLEDLIASGFSKSSAQQFYNAFQQGKSGVTIEEKVEALNSLLKINIVSENEANGNGLARASQIIAQAFSDNTGLTSESFSDLDEYLLLLVVCIKPQYSYRTIPLRSKGLLRRQFRRQLENSILPFLIIKVTI